MDAHDKADPTALTTALLQRELENLHRVIESRLDGMDKLMILQRADKIESSDFLAKEINHAQDLNSAVFKQVFTEFSTLKERTEQHFTDKKIAVDIAFSAAEKLVGKQNEYFIQSIAKSELANEKLMDQMARGMKAIGENAATGLEGLRLRIATIEAHGNTYKESRDDSKSIIALIIAALAVAVSIFLNFKH